MMRKNVAGLIALPWLVWGGQAGAVPVTLVGTDVSYSFESADLGLFGTPVVSGNDLVFSPSSFAATTGIASAATQTIHVTVTANAGYTLTGFALNESGGYSLAGSGAQVWVTGSLGALDIEGNPNLSAQHLDATLASSFGPADWTAQAGVTLPASGWGGVDGIVGTVGLTISNQLFAYALPGGSASVYKDVVALTGFASPAPEPGAYAMLLAGLGVVGLAVRRRRRAA